MCLKSIDHAAKLPTGEVLAYKVFDYHLRNLNFNYDADKQVLINQWFSATGYRTSIEADSGDRYLLGFHALSRLHDARRYANKTSTHDSCILPVRLRGVHTIGWQHDVKVMVATEMFIEADRYAFFLQKRRGWSRYKLLIAMTPLERLQAYLHPYVPKHLLHSTPAS